MKLNKKGFTLVELLAVIVILAVIMLVAVTAVGPAITNSKKGAFFSSVAAMEDAAVLYATTEGLTISTCVKDSTLVSKGYLNKKDSNFTGYVQITVSGNQYSYAITATNKEYSVSGKAVSGISKDGTGFDSPVKTSVTAPSGCV